MVAAAGRGLRLGVGRPKAFRNIDGTPLLVRALRGLDGTGLLVGGAVVVASDQCAEADSLLRAATLASRWHVVAGGATRQESVAHGLQALPVDVDVVLVHDAARPFVPAEVVRRVLTAVEAGADAVVPVVPVADTVKQLDGDTVVATLDRSALAQAQTPQGFRRTTLDAAYRVVAGEVDPVVTDDAGFVERAGGVVLAVAGDPRGFKVTGPLDLLLAEALAPRSRTGESTSW